MAVIVRAEDGVFQPMLLKPLACGHGTTIYRLTGCVLRRVGIYEDGPAILSLTELSEDVFVFVNVPLETANHFFLEALTKVAMRPDCGVVAGLLIDERRRILNSRRDITWGGAPLDDHVQAVTNLAPYFFAVRHERLAAVGGLGVLSSRRMPQLLRRLLVNASEARLHAWVTPDAVATLAGVRKCL